MDHAYAAGLFDGEGTIGVYAVNGPSRDYYAPKLQLVGTHRPMIEAVYLHYGVGSFTTQKRQAIHRTPRGEEVFGKQGWRWSVTSRPEIAEILPLWVPHLIEKREQAQVVLDLIDGSIDGATASQLCKALKRFSYPAGEFEEYAPRKLGGNAGARNPSATTTIEQVEKIRSRLALGERGSDVARAIGVSKHVVSKIKTGKTWRGTA